MIPHEGFSIQSLRDSLTRISEHHCPRVDNPEGCRRRASVSLIVRVRPDFNHWPGNEQINRESTISLDLDQFFSSSWVQHGDPEIAFIKRAARDGDRWTSHVALPGGKRDPGDTDDKSVAIRETVEEIGLDLSSNDALYIGNLPERLISAALGTVPIMILCPFVFLWTKAVIPPLRLQPGEVASIHWVPLRTLMSPLSRTFEYVNISDRFVKRNGTLIKSILRSTLGLMEFSAIRLSPSESLYCSSTEEFFPKTELKKSNPEKSLKSSFSTWNFFSHDGSLVTSKPLLLWGLTLGILVDFLDHIPPYNAIDLWSYPNFTNYDARFIICLLTIPLKRRNRRLLKTEIELTNQASFDNKIETLVDNCNSISDERLSDLKRPLKLVATRNKSHAQTCSVGIMLEGYYDKVRRGAFLAISLRIVGIILIAIFYLKKF